MQQRIGVLVEQALAVVLGRKAVSEPVREPPGLPAVKMEDRALGYVLPVAVPASKRAAIVDPVTVP